MKTKNQDFMLGLAVIALVALFLASFFFLYDSKIFKPPTQTITVRFALDKGMARLSEGGEVLLRGALAVGKITSVEIQRGESGESLGIPSIIVTAEIREDVTLFQDCRITTNEPVIGGSGFLVILDVGSPTLGAAPPLIEGERPQSLSAAIGDLSDWLLASDGFLSKLDQMFDAGVEGSAMNKLMASLEDINVITREIAGELDADEQDALMFRIHRVMDNVAGVTAALRMQVDAEVDTSLLGKVLTTLDELDASLVHVRQMLEESRPQFASTVDNVESITRALDQDIIGGLKAELDRADPTSLLAKIHVSMDRAADSLENVRVATETGKRMVVLNRPAIDSTIRNLKETTDQMKGLVLDIMLNPWRMIAPDKAEQRRMEVFQAAQMFAQAAARLDDVVARLDALNSVSAEGEQSAADAADLAELRSALQSAFDQFKRAEEYLWEHVK